MITARGNSSSVHEGCNRRITFLAVVSIVNFPFLHAIVASPKRVANHSLFTKAHGLGTGDVESSSLDHSGSSRSVRVHSGSSRVDATVPPPQSSLGHSLLGLDTDAHPSVR